MEGESMEMLFAKQDRGLQWNAMSDKHAIEASDQIAHRAARPHACMHLPLRVRNAPSTARSIARATAPIGPRAIVLPCQTRKVSHSRSSCISALLCSNQA